MFCHIMQNRCATSLTSRMAVVELVANTTSKTGLTIRCDPDTNTYPKGMKVSDDTMATLNLKGDVFYPDWNYSIVPRDQNGTRQFLEAPEQIWSDILVMWDCHLK